MRLKFYLMTQYFDMTTELKLKLRADGWYYTRLKKKNKDCPWDVLVTRKYTPKKSTYPVNIELQYANWVSTALLLLQRTLGYQKFYIMSCKQTEKEVITIEMILEPPLLIMENTNCNYINLEGWYI